MSLRHGLIGLLAREGPQTGYQLARAFDRSVNFVWHARHGQIYPELARLAEAGLIRHVEDGPRGAKVYEVTDAGIAELRRWILDVPVAVGTRNETLLRVFFGYLVEPAELEAFLLSEAARYRGLLGVLEGFAAGEATSPSERASELTVHAGIRMLNAQIDWAEWAANEVRTWPPAQAVSSGDRAGRARRRARRPRG